MAILVLIRRFGGYVKELIRSNDPVLLSYLMSVLEEERIDAILLDEHTSILEGSIGAIQRRIMVLEEDLERAKDILDDIGEGETPA
ncbi:DUF2007 domain-containing protein [Sneathiella chungangensis]|uniref:putative signal transducing protein n=1 Tax=Sneathiella chungangensis TaxID=1418234 RepID=UPI0019CFDE59|nr:DUF2007 domain-containing protein [Sneathiella chungangensis]